MSRRNLRRADADREPHDAGSRTGAGRWARQRGLQQRGRRARRRRADSRPRRRRGPRDARAGSDRRPRRHAPPPAAGAPPPRRRRQRFRQVNRVRRRSRRMRPRRAAGGGLFRPSGVVYAVSADGMFRTLGLVSGKDVQRPAPFLPAGARFSDLIAVGDMVYTATSHGCGGAANGIWAINVVGRPEDRRLVEDQRRRSHRLGRVRNERHGDRGDWPGSRHVRRLRERHRRARPEDAHGEGLVHAARRRARCAARRVSRGWQGHRGRHDQGWAHSAARRRLSRRHESRLAALRVGVVHWRRRDVCGAVTGHVAGTRGGPAAAATAPARRACCSIRAAGGRWRTLAARSGRGPAAGEPGSSREWRRVDRSHTRRQDRAPGASSPSSQHGYRGTSPRR